MKSEKEKGIAVFGASEPGEGEPDYRRAVEVGRQLALRGATVISGGYGGVMEAVSRGATEHGGRAIGVTCRIFRGRRPNPYLDLEIPEPDLLSRTQRMIWLARGFIILPGAAGTLAELSVLWALARAGELRRPVVLFDELWREFYGRLSALGRLDERCRAVTRVAEDPGQAAELALTEIRQERLSNLDDPG